MREHSSGLRAAMAAAVLLLATSVGLAAFLVGRHDAMLRPEVVSKLAAVARSVADQVGLALDYGIPFETIRGMDQFLDAAARPNPEVAYIAVTDAQGRVLQKVGAVAGDFPPASPAPEDGMRDGALDVAWPLMGAGGLAGSVHIGTREAGSAAARLMAMAVVAAVVGGGAAAALVLAFARRAVERPLGRLRSALSAAPLAAVPLADGQGEVAAVMREARRLLDDLAEHRAAFRLEMDEIALAQPDAEGRRAIEALAEGGAP